jgi:hypothetical protein
MAEMPFYLEKTGFKDVSSPPGPFEHALNYSGGHFRWLVDTPDMLNSFNSFMSGQRQYRTNWYDTFPVDEILYPKEESESGDGASEESTLFIDIAGGGGHDIEAFHKSYPDAPGKLVLQDLPETIDQIEQLSPTITRMKYDFFTEQPIKGARAYYFRSIFHDWPDKQCIQIMKNTAAAMKRGYSKLLIFEFVIPEKNAPLYPASLDINLMAIFNGMERTRSQWTALLDAAGLEILKVWSSGDDTEGLIEAQLK